MPWRLLSTGFYALLRLPDGRIGFSHTSDLQHHHHTTTTPLKSEKRHKKDESAYASICPARTLYRYDF